MLVTYRRKGPDFNALYRTVLDSDYGCGNYITHYIRFFPDGTLLSLYAPDFWYGEEGCYQEPRYIRSLLVPGVSLDDDPFGILAGTFSVTDGVLTYRINIGSEIFEEGTGYFFAVQYSACEESLHLDFHNHHLDDKGQRDYGSWD